MLQLKVIREDKQRIINGLLKRNWSETQLEVIDQIIRSDDERRSGQKELDDTLAEQNRLAKQIGALMGQGKKDEAGTLKIQVGTLKEKSRQLEDHQRQTDQDLETLLLSVPNVPHTSVPAGKTPEDNEVWQAWEKPLPDLPDDALAHWDLAKKYNLFDLELGVKLTGAGFPCTAAKVPAWNAHSFNSFWMRRWRPVTKK